jgi:hypothetical protein
MHYLTFLPRYQLPAEVWFSVQLCAAGASSPEVSTAVARAFGLRATGLAEIVVADDQADPHVVGGKPEPRLLDMPGVAPEQVGRFYRVLRPHEAGPFRVAISSPGIRG